MTPPQEFVTRRLAAMAAIPGMWGSSQESFGMQLILLVEIYQLEPELPKTSVRDIMLKLFGPGTGVPIAPLDDAWARASVAAIRQILATP